MREIKFRAWGKYTHRMWDVLMVDIADKEVTVVFCDGDEQPTSVYFDHIELMQYTGCKDKNGKEIYEGDILKHGKLNDREKSDALYKVEWNEERMGYFFEPVKFHLSMGIDLEKAEVIGNIHESPEMLEVSK